MKKTLTLLLFALAAMVGHAQDVTIDLTEQEPYTQDKVNVTIGGVNLQYIKATSPNSGANIYSTWADYQLKIASSEKKIAVMEIVGCGSKTSSTREPDLEVIAGGGVLDHHPNGRSLWTGGAQNITFVSSSKGTYFIQKLRIWFEGTTYVPTPEGEDNVGGTYKEPSVMGQPWVRTSALPVAGKPVSMAIVSVRKFAAQVQKYALWKTKQGYQVEEVYADDYSENGAVASYDLAAKVREHLKQTRPAFVLIMGDDDDVPAFKGTQKQNDQASYITDYFYGEYDEGDDYFAEAYVGRFSAYDAEDLEIQMDKTMYMAKLSADKGEWVKKSLCLVAPDGSDASIISGDENMKCYLRTLGNDVIEGGVHDPGKVNDYINAGCGIVTYHGHGFYNSLNSDYTLGNVMTLQNKELYPVMLANTCLTGSFEIGGWKSVYCLAEAMQRKKDGGTVAYIGNTRMSYGPSDNFFYFGGNKSDEQQSYFGFMRSLFPLSPEDAKSLNQRARTIGEACAIGRYSSRLYTPLYHSLNAEYTTLFGDPTYQPYYTTPKTQLFDAPEAAVAGHVIKITTAPEAVVCISKDRTIWAVGVADSKGLAYLTTPENTPAGEYTLYSSAPEYTDYETTLTLSASDHTQGGDEESSFDWDDYERHLVLIEKFTGLQCYWCGSDNTILNNYLTEKDLHSNVYELRHNSYIPADRFSLSWHTTLKDKWEVSGHPTYLVDRTGDNGERFVNAGGYNTRAESIRNTDWITNRLKAPCRLSLTLDGTTFDPDTRIMKVVVSGKAQTKLPDLCVNLFIALNGAPANQSGEGMTTINGISRDYLTESVFGDKLNEHEDGTFQVEYFYQLPESIGADKLEPSNLDIVAFVTSWDNYKFSSDPRDKDFSDSEVHNTIARCIGDLPLTALAPELPKSEGTTGISFNANDRECANQYFDLTGRSYIRQPKSGIFMLNGKKIIR